MEIPNCRYLSSILISIRFEQNAITSFKHVRIHFTTLVDLLEDFSVTFELNLRVTCLHKQCLVIPLQARR